MSPRRRALGPAPSPVVVYFDQDCALCQAAVRHWRRRDRAGRLVFCPADTPEAEATTGRSRDALLTALHVRQGTSLRSGARALAAVYRALPGGRPWAVLLEAASWLGLGELCYRWLADHRHAVGRAMEGLGTWKGEWRKGEQARGGQSPHSKGKGGR